MKKKMNDTLRKEVSDLAERSVMEQANADVFSRFDGAMAELDTDSRELLRHYFDGVPIAKLSERCGVEIHELELWLERTKKQLINSLRARCTVRQ